LPTAGRLERNLVPVGSQHGSHQWNGHRLQGEMPGKRRRILPLRRKVSATSNNLFSFFIQSPYLLIFLKAKRKCRRDAGHWFVCVIQLGPFRTGHTHTSLAILFVCVSFLAG
jgi:hypothetical protein